MNVDVTPPRGSTNYLNAASATLAITRGDTLTRIASRRRRVQQHWRDEDVPADQHRRHERVVTVSGDATIGP